MTQIDSNVQQAPTDALVHDLLRRNLLEVFGERDPARRRTVIAQIWAEDGEFTDSHGRSIGHAAIDQAIAVLHARLPDFVFQERGAAQAFFGVGRVAWGFGLPGQAPRVTGIDVIEVRGGRIQKLCAFLD